MTAYERGIDRLLLLIGAGIALFAAMGLVGMAL